MRARPFPYISIAAAAISTVVLNVSNTIQQRHCAFGFGGFQCNSPFSGYGETLLTTTLASFAVLVVSAAIAAWKLIAWFRSR
ncbi:hypothetical protein [Sinorhizobium sp. RAC02]|uniref:hypothetical protein n=1 Tax=Sinorhizobium sp. RAC02 TaxID=1842534 RepID=UPI00083D9EBD|nr:hypothetical protein [Sinorhizobium sp. RAC02]AOF90124.1 putative membrane protein [Sinorhizobium sp. RAC02]